MIPDWMGKTAPYAPPRGSGAYVLKTIRAIGSAMARLSVQRGQTGRLRLPAAVKLLLLLGLLILIAAVRNRLVLLAVTALLLANLCLLPAAKLAAVLRSAAAAALFALILVLPAMLVRPAARANQLTLVWRVFLSVTALNLFNRSTQWNDVTAALRKLRVPAVFVFLLDLTLKYIVLLGTLLQDLLTALHLRAVGKNGRKYGSVGGVMGVTFLRSAELSRETAEAMRCRGFTDDYKGL